MFIVSLEKGNAILSCVFMQNILFKQVIFKRYFLNDLRDTCDNNDLRYFTLSNKSFKLTIPGPGYPMVDMRRSIFVK